MKRKQPPQNGAQKRHKQAEVELSESDVDLDDDVSVASEEEEDPLDHETPDEARLRLARQYLDTIKPQQSEVEEKESLDHDVIAHRLQQDVLESTGRMFRKVAASLSAFHSAKANVRSLRGHKLSPTCVALTEDESTAYSGGKDCCVIKWDIETGQKVVFAGARKQPEKGGHFEQVLCVSVSSDGRYVASGGRDKLVRIWDARTHTLVDSFRGHKDGVTGLAFQPGGHQLYSTSMDRAVKIWNVDERAYVDSLFGHQSDITAIDVLTKERIVTSSRDRSVRIWKVTEDTQLLFKGHQQSIDCVKAVHQEHFVTGSQDGSIGLWHVTKKRPLCTVDSAHAAGSSANWISSVGVLKHTDLVATGSCDGSLRLWQADLQNKSITAIASVPVVGWINGIEFARSGRFAVLAVGQEHRFGRWVRVGEARNGLCLVNLDLERAMQ
eukprot:GILJ01003540.1.p1 GENE.GILJ01003540.1~~GILJ01003540.1.p1  ORF type:complete len:439 (+),score=48.53 GILJ01003540.1:26-1342(+)